VYPQEALSPQACCGCLTATPLSLARSGLRPPRGRPPESSTPRVCARSRGAFVGGLLTFRDSTPLRLVVVRLVSLPQELALLAFQAFALIREVKDPTTVPSVSWAYVRIPTSMPTTARDSRTVLAVHGLFRHRRRRTTHLSVPS
jgi:hypothetical protein